MKRVLIVDDSLLAREVLAHILSQDPEIAIAGTASSGAEAVILAGRLKPDVITMDINMPGMDGFETTRKIMETHPVPVVIVTASFSREDAEKTFRATQAGAVTIMEKPRGPGSPQNDPAIRELIDTVKAMAEVRVVRRWSDKKYARLTDTPPVPLAPVGGPAEIVAIGASTGGPPALHDLLGALPPDYPLPILIVQHIAPGFLNGLADWLAQTTPFKFRIPIHGEQPLRGCAYLAPDGYQMGVLRGNITVTRDPPEGGHRPAVAHLFNAAAAAYGPRAIGVLLTGMGADGAAGLLEMRRTGAVTFAQDRETSAVHGMPGEAIRLGAAVHVMPPVRIAQTLSAMALRQT